MRVLVEIKACDIKRGKFVDSMSCAAALGLQRLFPTQRVVVSTDLASVDDKDYRLSKRLSAWIKRFDDRRPVKPGRFALYPVPARPYTY